MMIRLPSSIELIFFQSSCGNIARSSFSEWLKKSIEIQWDYKNIVKRKGKLVRL